MLAAYGELMLGDTAAAARDGAEAVEILAPLGDAWGLVHATAMLGGIAQVEHRFADAIDALSSAARGVHGPGLPGTGGPPSGVAGPRPAACRRPRRRDRLVRAGPQRGDGRRRRKDGRDGQAQPRPAARTTGDGAAAVPWLRENLEWYASAGGGDGALLTRCLLAIETSDRDSLDVVLALARADETHLVTVLALDGLARLHAEAGDDERARELVAEADALHPVVAHLLDDADRPDRAAVVSRAVPST